MPLRVLYRRAIERGEVIASPLTYLEAYKHEANSSGVVTTLGFAVAFTIHTLA